MKKSHVASKRANSNMSDAEENRNLFQDRLNEAIKKIMTARGMSTYEDFAKFMGVTNPTVTKWRNGSQLITAHHLAKIARISQTSCDELLLGEGEAMSRRRNAIAEYEASRSRQFDDYSVRMRHYEVLSADFGFEIYKQFTAQCELIRTALMDVNSQSFNNAVLGRGQLTLPQLRFLEGVADIVLLVGKPSIDVFVSEEHDGISRKSRQYFYLCEQDDDLNTVADAHFKKLSSYGFGPLTEADYSNQVRLARCSAPIFPFADFFLHRIADDVELPPEYKILLKDYTKVNPSRDMGDLGYGRWIGHICISPERDHHLLLDSKRIERAIKAFWSLWRESSDGAATSGAPAVEDAGHADK